MINPTQALNRAWINPKQGREHGDFPLLARNHVPSPAAWLSDLPASSRELLVSALSRNQRNVSNGKNLQRDSSRSAQPQPPQE